MSLINLYNEAKILQEEISNGLIPEYLALDKLKQISKELEENYKSEAFNDAFAFNDVIYTKILYSINTSSFLLSNKVSLFELAVKEIEKEVREYNISISQDYKDIWFLEINKRKKILIPTEIINSSSKNLEEIKTNLRNFIILEI